jgi:lysozyme family protein
MARFDLAIPITLAFEGGYVNSPSDPGGETNFGISKRSYPNVDIRNLTKEGACLIYKHDFWKYDGIGSQMVANKLFDAGVNEGVERAVRMMQQLVGVVADGKYGSLTEGGINGSDQYDLLFRYRARLGQYYKDLAEARPEEAGDLKGWLKRAYS